MPAPARTKKTGPSQSAQVAGLEGRRHEHELAVSGHNVVVDFFVAVAGSDPFADDAAEVAGEFGIGVVDRLILTDEAAKVFRNLPRALFLRRIGETFRWIDQSGGSAGPAPSRATR